MDSITAVASDLDRYADEIAGIDQVDDVARTINFGRP